MSLVGYTGETCVAALEEHASIRKCLISPPAVRKLKLPRSLFLLAAPFKVLQQLLQLFWVLCVVVEAPDAILVQNPPAIPALLVVHSPRACLRSETVSGVRVVVRGLCIGCLNRVGVSTWIARSGLWPCFGVLFCHSWGVVRSLLCATRGAQ